MEQAVLSLRGGAVVEGGSGDAPDSAGAEIRAQSKLGSRLQRRRTFHAGQVGVPMVRRLGSRISHDSICVDRSGFCEKSTGAFVAGVVPVAQRAVAGL